MDRSAVDPQDILRQRAAPAIYVVDADCRVVLGWQAPNGIAASEASSNARLPADLERAVAELQCALRAGANAPMARLLDSEYVVRVAPLAGLLGQYDAVLVERFRSRDQQHPKRRNLIP